jgi:hypothetical protein
MAIGPTCDELNGNSPTGNLTKWLLAKMATGKVAIALSGIVLTGDGPTDNH